MGDAWGIRTHSSLAQALKPKIATSTHHGGVSRQIHTPWVRLREPRRAVARATLSEPLRNGGALLFAAGGSALVLQACSILERRGLLNSVREMVL